SIPAAAVGAAHLRDRVWILAYPRQEFGANEGRDHAPRGRYNVFPKRDIRLPSEWGKDWELATLVPGVHPRSSADWWIRQSNVARSVNGTPRELVDARSRAYGYAVVP